MGLWLFNCKRLHEFNISAKIVSIVNNAEILFELPPKPLIFSGGITEVTSEINWIVESRKFIKETIKANLNSKKADKLPMLGICFGAQLLIESYDSGSVIYLEDPEIGITNVNINKTTHPLLKNYETDFQAYTFHYNQIKSEKVDILSSHQHMNHEFIQIFEIPNTSVFGVQFHPEFNYNDFLTLIKTYKKLIKDLGLDPGIVRSKLPDFPNNSEILSNFYQSYC